MQKIMTCLACPRGCRLAVTARKAEIVVTGNHCSKGPEYARGEIEAPMRILTTTVRTAIPGSPRLPVKTASAVPLDQIPRYMAAVNRIVVQGPLRCGDIVAADPLGTGVALLATDDLPDGNCRQTPL